MSRELPSFDFVVATVGRTDELARFVDSIEAQRYEPLRVIVVDQNDDDRLTTVLDGRNLTIARIHAERGLSHARNAGLQLVTAELVAFPDDDCVYPPGLLTRVGERFAAVPDLAGVTGRTQDSAGRSSESWSTRAATLTDDNLWNRVNAATIFVRRELVERVGAFDERLGLGSGEPWSSGEEVDFLIRAVRGGARIDYDPTVVVVHDVVEDDSSIGYRDGATIGYLLRKHGYPLRVVARMLARPLGGVLVSLVRLDRSRAAYSIATLRGRVRGYRRTSSSKRAA